MADGSEAKAAAPPAAVQRPDRPQAARGMVVFLGTVTILYFGQAVLVPVTLALLLAFLLGPMVKLFRRLHLGRVPSVLLGVILALGVIVMIGGVIGTQIAELSGNLPQYTATVETKVKKVQADTVGRVSAIVDRLNPHKAAPAHQTAAPAAAPEPSAPLPSHAPDSSVLGFYQSILANDPDEPQHQAEQLLKQRSLTSYYHEVTLKGLQLAANDAKRGVLNRDQLDRIKSTIKTVVHSSHNHDDKTPPAEPDADVAGAPDDEGTPSHEASAPSASSTPWSQGHPVMCIAGRGPLDEAAASMLEQLLDKHDMQARLVPYPDVSRDHIETLNIAGVKMVCLSYLDISGSPGHLRYLMRRLRGRLPEGTPILDGLWPAEDAELKDPKVRAEVGADYYTSSLGEAVAACAKAASADD